MKHEAKKHNTKKSHVELMAEMSQEQIAEKMKFAGTPGEPHALLSKLAGTWNTEGTFWMNPNQEPISSPGTAVNKEILGGRYLETSYVGKFMGNDFKGQGLLGYDNVSGRYFSTWIDSMSTGLFRAKGRATGGNKIVFNSRTTCPMSGAKLNVREVITFIDKDHYSYESFNIDKGKRHKQMKILYTRAN